MFELLILCNYLFSVNSQLDCYVSDGRENKRNCGDEATESGRREPENIGGYKRKVYTWLPLQVMFRLLYLSAYRYVSF